MYCKHCGSELLQDVKFCTNCGCQIDEEKQNAAQNSFDNNDYQEQSNKGTINDLKNQFQKPQTKKQKPKGVGCLCIAILFFVIVITAIVLSATSGNDNSVETEKNKTTTESTTLDSLHDNIVDGNEEVILMTMSKDIAKDVSKYPSTTEILTNSWTFEQKDLTYTTCCTFECSNTYGVKETHILVVIAETDDNGSKIHPVDVAIDGASIKSYN